MTILTIVMVWVVGAYILKYSVSSSNNIDNLVEDSKFTYILLVFFLLPIGIINALRELYEEVRDDYRRLYDK